MPVKFLANLTINQYLEPQKMLTGMSRIASPSLKLTDLADNPKVDVPIINFWFEALQIVLAGALLLLVAVALALAALKEFSASNTAWKTHSQRATAIGDMLAELKNDIGYGGFIHNFKNLVLRRDVNRY